MSNDEFDHYNACYKTLEFFILNICSFITNKSSALRRTNQASTMRLMVIYNNYYSKRTLNPCTLLRVFAAYYFLLIYLLVYRRGLSNDVIRDAALPWYQRNYAIAIWPKAYVLPCYFVALHHPQMFPDKNTFHSLTQSESRIMRYAERITLQ